MKALHFDPDQRHESIAVFIQELFQDLTKNNKVLAVPTSPESRNAHMPINRLSKHFRKSLLVVRI
jgi:hypothetical protein